MAEPRILIAGAGMTGMMAALLLARRVDPARITLIESAAVSGGNYRSVSIGGQRFDQGMRMLYETGDAELDALIHGLLPERDWHIYRGNEKDIAGIYWRGALQQHSPYIDLRRLPTPYSLPERIGQSGPDAASQLAARFGPPVAALLGEVLHKLYGQPAEQLDAMALHQPAMNRVVLLDSDALQAQLHNEATRARVAWPDQLTMPPLRSFDQAALYPRRYGMDAVIDALQARLDALGVTLLFGRSVAALTQQAGRITRAMLDDGTPLDITQLYWTGSPYKLAALLGMEAAAPAAAPHAQLAYFRLRKPPAMGRLYHFYVFDEGFHSFRVTHYASYCPAVEGYPLCVELWHMKDASPQTVLATAGQELVRMGIAEAGHIEPLGVASTANLHAHCSLADMASLRQVRGQLQAGVPNATWLGAFAREGQMLLYEVWRDMTAQIGRYDG